MQAESKECNAQVTISVPVFAGSIFGSSAVSFITGIIIGLLCGIKYILKKVKKTILRQNISPPEDNPLNSIKGPVYEEVGLEEQTASIELSSNIAYEHVRNTASK